MRLAYHTYINTTTPPTPTSNNNGRPEKRPCLHIQYRSSGCDGIWDGNGVSADDIDSLTD